MVFCKNLSFYLSRKARIFFQNLTLGYMSKSLNQIFFFPPPKSEYLFSATLGINNRTRTSNRIVHE
jgi:hypothetical protein